MDGAYNEGQQVAYIYKKAFGKTRATTDYTIMVSRKGKEIRPMFTLFMSKDLMPGDAEITSLIMHTMRWVVESQKIHTNT